MPHRIAALAARYQTPQSRPIPLDKDLYVESYQRCPCSSVLPIAQDDGYFRIKGGSPKNRKVESYDVPACIRGYQS